MVNLKPECASVRYIVEEQFECREKVRILEAGCGSSSALKIPDNAYVVGVDISEQQLRKNELLDERHHGDIQNYTFAEESFDMIICWNVLEHLPKPERALENFARWLAPGGIMILALPNVFSTTALAAKFTPFWFHIWWYRNILGIKEAGRYGNGPFKTFLRSAISISELLRFAKRHQLYVKYAKLYTPSDTSRRGHYLLKRTICKGFEFLGIIIDLAAFRKFQTSKFAIILILENPRIDNK